MRVKTILAAMVGAAVLAGPSNSQNGFDNRLAADNGWSMEQSRSAAWHFAQHRRLSGAIAALQPQRPGIVDAYVVSIGLDSDPVFGREAGEAQKVLARRYGAVGRSIFLAAGAGPEAIGAPQGSPPQSGNRPRRRCRQDEPQGGCTRPFCYNPWRSAASGWSIVMATMRSV